MTTIIRRARAQDDSRSAFRLSETRKAFFIFVCPRNTRKNAKEHKAKWAKIKAARFGIESKCNGEDALGEIIYKEEAYKIIGACFEVYKNKGIGFTEPMYQECLQIEFSLQQIPFVPQPKLILDYKGTTLEQFFKPDFLCYGKIVVEIKALDKLIDIHRAQTINYLNATGFELALLVNFGHYPKLEYERIVHTRNRPQAKSIGEEMASWFEMAE